MTSVPAHPGPFHAAAVYNSDEDLRARVLTFMRAGLEGGEAVVVVVSERAEKIADHRQPVPGEPAAQRGGGE